MPPGRPREDGVGRRQPAVNAIRFSPAAAIRLVLLALPDGSASTSSTRGPACAEADRDRIFEPFYRGERQPEGAVRGTGIGLSIVHEYIVAHGGRIEVARWPRWRPFPHRTAPCRMTDPSAPGAPARARCRRWPCLPAGRLVVAPAASPAGWPGLRAGGAWRTGSSAAAGAGGPRVPMPTRPAGGRRRRRPAAPAVDAAGRRRLPRARPSRPSRRWPAGHRAAAAGDQRRAAARPDGLALFDASARAPVAAGDPAHRARQHPRRGRGHRARRVHLPHQALRRQGAAREGRPGAGAGRTGRPGPAARPTRPGAPTSSAAAPHGRAAGRGALVAAATPAC
jgi:hypothetical protein